MSEIRKGGLNDPVAQSIRNEQQRDAAPSAKEVREMERRHLAKNGCEVCDVSNPNHLTEVYVPIPGLCRNGQTPDRMVDETTLCDEHWRPGKTLGRAWLVQKARNQDADYLVTYTCGGVDMAYWNYPDESAPTQQEFDEMPARERLFLTSPPEVSVIHGKRDCAAPIDEVVTLDEF